MTDKTALVRSWRARLPVAAVVVACVAGVVAAVSGAANPVSAVQFLLPGHWVYNSSLQSVFHVDGSTGDVDAQAGVPGGAGDQVYQGDTSGYVVGESRITEFGKSSLSVEESTTPPSKEVPVGVETAGGPYLVYREVGKVVRLGDENVVLSLGGPVGTPVASRDGTLWLPRTKAGLLCQLPAKAKQVSCPVLLPKGHAGALSVVSNRLVFVDTTKDTLHVVEKDGLGEAQDLGVDAQDDARLASTDVAGRVAILDGQKMHLVDAGLGTAGIERAEPVTVDLGEGEYTGPVSTGTVVAVVNRTTNTLVTYDGEGQRKQTKELPPEKGDPRLTRGEDDRIYVDGAEGEHVVVVDKDGGLTDVPIKAGDGNDKAATPTGGQDPETPVAAPKPKPTTPKPTTPKPETPKPPTPTTSKPPPVEDPPPPPPPPSPPAVPASPPGAPTVVNATAGDASATVSWGPAPDNRSAITGYRITWAGGQTTVAANARTSVVPGLTNGTSYVFTVTAVNGIGAGPGSASNPVTPVAPVRPPSEPTNLAVDYNADTRTAVMSWDPPADLGGGTLAHYIISVTDRSDATVNGETATITDIGSTGTITFSVRAVTNTAQGQQVGARASTSEDVTPPAPTGTVSLSRGPETQEWCAGDPDCAWMHVVITGMQPNTSYRLMPHSSSPTYSNPGGSVTTDANGDAVTDQFAYHVEGDTVWVVATDPNRVETRSNNLVWETAQ
jgi:hypothetical protein